MGHVMVKHHDGIDVGTGLCSGLGCSQNFEWCDLARSQQRGHFGGIPPFKFWQGQGAHFRCPKLFVQALLG